MQRRTVHARRREGGEARAGRNRRSGALLSIVAIVASLFAGGAVLAPVQATAATSPENTVTVGGNTFFAYVGDGESLDVTFTKQPYNYTPRSDVLFRVTDPQGEVRMECTIAGGAATGTACTEAALSGPAGVWTIEEIPVTNVTEGTYLRPSANARFAFDIVVRDAAATALTGRVWTDIYMGYDQAGRSSYDIDFWLVSEYGAVYAAELGGFTGGGWAFDSNAYGIVDEGTCTALYRSTAMTRNVTTYEHAGPDCGDPYWVFFEEPSADLPVVAPSARGELWVLPEVAAPEIVDLAFARNDADDWAGEFSFGLRGFTGGYELRIDADGDGAFDGARDRVIALGGRAGAHGYSWDGLDGQGNPIDVCGPVAAEIAIERADEVHMVLTDVEELSRGIAVTQLRGNSPGNTMVYWDDSFVSTAGKTSTSSPVSAVDGIESTGGVHRWTRNGANSWGNMVAIDHWAYSPVDITESLDLGVGCLNVTKTSDATEDTRVGDTVTYTVTATNVGGGDYTEQSPAFLSDDLTGVLDDATYADDASADREGVLDYSEPRLTWAGPLAAGDTVTLTYSVTMTAGGDRVARNVAWANDPDGPTPECVEDDPTVACEDVILPGLRLVKEADREDLPAVGERVTYTVTVSNDGPGAFTETAPATATDDLSAVLDDAELDTSSLVATSGTVERVGDRLEWSGALAAGDTASFSYSVVYTGKGDHELTNVACVPEGDAVAGAPACDTVSIPGAGLSQSKSVDPADGSSVVAGQEVTYTLTFVNTGKAPAALETTDDLSGVLDDAVLVAGPVSSSEAVTAVQDGEQLLISGTIPVGETVTVSYSVVVSAFDEQGDHTLANVLADPTGVACDEGACATNNPVRHLVVTKTSGESEGIDTGDTVSYEITVTNVGEGDYTTEEPARVRDDLSGVLDDATYRDDAVATDGDVVFTAPFLDWSGALAAGESVTIRYSVDVTNAGDHQLVNVAGPVCEDGQEPCEPVIVTNPLPHVTPAKHSDPASGAEVVAGQVVTYTLSWTNDGEAEGVVDASDDLADVLDDATLTSAPVSDSARVEVVQEDETLKIRGPIAPGETVTVTYAVTIGADGARGNNKLSNVLVPDNPRVPPTDPVEHPVPELEIVKTVDPASGTTVRSGDVLTYTLTFTSSGAAPAEVNHEDVLTNVLDDASVTQDPVSSDPALSVSEVTNERFAVTGVLQPGQTVTVTYQVTVHETGERGDDVLRNAVVPAGEEPGDSCDPQSRTCTVNHVSDVTVVKSADPEDGTAVASGQRVTYTLTFTNVGASAAATAADVDYTDHMSGVLDDAELTSGPESSSAALAAALEGDVIRITGALAPGDVVTVTYSVVVKEYEDQGDHVLGNVVALTGAEPICAPESPMCTTHPVPPVVVDPPTPAPASPTSPGEPLAVTGGTLSMGALVLAAVALVIGGSVLAVSRLRREREGAQAERR